MLMFCAIAARRIANTTRGTPPTRAMPRNEPTSSNNPSTPSLKRSKNKVLSRNEEVTSFNILIFSKKSHSSFSTMKGVKSRITPLWSIVPFLKIMSVFTVNSKTSTIG